MPVVFACIAPHGGHLTVAPPMVSPVPHSRTAMEQMHRALQASRPDSLAIITPHGVTADGVFTMAISPVAAGDLDGIRIEARTDIDLAAAWAYHAASFDIPVAPVATQSKQVPFPLDWGVTIPISILDPGQTLPIVVACPSRELDRRNLVDWGEALSIAADDVDRRVALIVSADQGHGHAADGPYGFSPISTKYDEAMRDAIRDDDLERLLDWDNEWIETALPDSYWQTLSLIGLRRRVPLTSCFLSYEVDHYFGLLCAMYESAGG
jgi:aromatic ring-opening dioxygenase LigB subunit